MQLMLLFGIACAIAAVAFALQNDVPVTVTLALWRYDGSLAMVLLLALGLGVIIAGLVSSPVVIKGQWAAARLRRQLSGLESENAALARRAGEMEAEIARLGPAPRDEPADPRPYVGLRALMSSGKTRESPE